MVRRQDIREIVAEENKIILEDPSWNMYASRGEELRYDRTDYTLHHINSSHVVLKEKDSGEKLYLKHQKFKDFWNSRVIRAKDPEEYFPV